MAYTIAGIDVHKRMLAVVVSDLAADAEDAFERRPFGSTPAQLRLLADWLSERQVDEVVMESALTTPGRPDVGGQCASSLCNRVTCDKVCE